jgi:hypothetical protein
MLALRPAARQLGVIEHRECVAHAEAPHPSGRALVFSSSFYLQFVFRAMPLASALAASSRHVVHPIRG